MKKLFLLCVLACLASTVSTQAASSLRSHTLDIRKTIIDFNITDFVTKNIFAKATLDVQCKMNGVNQMVFDLEGLTVDSILINNSLVSYSTNGFYLTVNTASTLNQNDTALVDIYYHGVPIADATWGGFSFIGNYGFQMGVGFNAQPHSFGRTWHPCFDNFVERSAYEFYITTNIDKMGICNGLLLDSITNPNNTKTWHWKLQEEIPSYLAAVAVCNYVLMHKNLNGINGNTDALIACEVVDTNKVNGSFAHLQESFSMLEENFGAHSWPKVGYTLVPFNAGAMEHATNIHIGRPFIDGTLNYETLIAHELSHHWWGDLVTCSTAGDMWLNEGFASYCEFLHQEYTYGYSAYLDAIKANHFQVVSKAHINDDGYRSVANMDSIHTYGTTVYLKGADMIHTMRSYLGDSLFFNGLTAFLNANKFKHISSFDLRDFLSTYTGFNMTNYFNNWIFDQGFTHFSIDSTQVVPNGAMQNVSIFLRQRKHKNTNYYDGVPLEIGIYDAQMTKHVFKLTFNGRCMQFNVQLPFVPSMIVIDPDSKISDAITEEQKIVKIVGNTIFNQAKCRLLAKAINNTSDSSLIRIEHSWIAPDRFKTTAAANGFILCDSRYWKIDGINLNNVQGLLQFSYDAGPNNSYLDSVWIKNTDDSIRLFYRKDATEEWYFANDSIRPGTINDKNGSIYAREIKAGEYCFGIQKSNMIDPIQTDAPTGGCGLVTKASAIEKIEPQFTLFPIPAFEQIQIRSQRLKEILNIDIYDLSGRIILHLTQVPQTSDVVLVDISSLSSGTYIVQLRNEYNAILHAEKITKN
jgi:aminopeptidase N